MTVLQVMLTLSRQDGDTRQAVNVRLQQIMDRFVDTRLEVTCFATPRMREHRLLATGPAGQVALMIMVYWSITLNEAQRLLATAWSTSPRSALGDNHDLTDKMRGGDVCGA